MQSLRAHREQATERRNQMTEKTQPTDAELFALIKEHFGLDQRRDDTVINRSTGRFHDAQRYRDFAAAVLALAKWGQPAVAGEPVATQWLAEMIMSDCGCSTGNQRLLDRIIDRIQQYDRANAAPQPVAREPLTHAQAKALVSKYGNDPLHLVYQVEAAHGIKGGQHGTE
jgi:hypothetical protein